MIYSRGSRKRERLPSNTESGVVFSESEERITGTWSPHKQESGLELYPMGDGTGLRTNVGAGEDLEHGKGDWESKETIVKTVQISQYRS
jgi:hypothetical protein